MSREPLCNMPRPPSVDRRNGGRIGSSGYAAHHGGGFTEGEGEVDCCPLPWPSLPCDGGACWRRHLHPRPLAREQVRSE